MERLRAEPFDLLLMDLNYYARHDVGPRRPRADSARPRPRSGAADRRHDRVGQHRHGRRGDAPRRQELRPEAVGGRHAARDPRARDRRGAGRAAARSAAAARARGRAADSARPAPDRRAAGRRHRSRASRGSRPTASAATVSTRWRSARALGVSIADIAGKGLPAALLMSNLQAAVRAFAQEAAPPSSICGSVNRLLCRNMASGRFATFCYARIEPAPGRIVYSNAGHNPPLLDPRRRHDRAAVEGGMVLGVFPDNTYEQAEDAARAAAIAWSSTPTASPRRATPKATSTARSA